jgi:putative DNA primase/helicase
MSASDTPLVALSVDGIPAYLRAMPQWVCWQIKPPKKPGDKFGKVPINPHTGGAASSTDAKTWSTFPEALARMEQEKLPGVGIVFAGTGEFGVDLDHCRDPKTGTLEPWATKIVEQLDTYTEISPSGTGLHLIGRGELPEGRRKNGQIEMYDRGRFFTVTGVALPGTRPEVADRTEAVAALHDEVFGTPQQKPSATGAPIGPGPEDDDKLIERASKTKSGAKFKALFGGDTSGYPSQSEAELALCSLLSSITNGDPRRVDRLFRRSGLFRDKWDERHGEFTYGELTIRKATSSTRLTASSGTDEATPAFAGQSPPFTDSGNAERLVARFGESLRYCAEWKKWLAFRGGRWGSDRIGFVMACSKKVARQIYNEAARCDDPTMRDTMSKWARASEKVDRRKAMVTLAQCEPGIPVVADQLDRHPHLFNCANGTLDLESGTLRPHDRADYLTKICPTSYIPSAPSPTWDQFLERVVPDDDERAYLLRFFGYSLSGDTSEQVLLFLDGDGLNGKSTLVLALQYVLSPNYAIQISADLLLTKDQERHPTEIADLAGVRLAIGTETPQNKALDERLMKQLTGCDRLRARRMREDFWEFEPTHKLVLVTNHLPKANVSEFAVARRLHVVRFGVRIRPDEIDRKLLTKLKAEREGILARLVEGFRDWRQQGLNPPESVLAFGKRPTAREKTPVEEFIDQCLVSKAGERTRASEIYTAFVEWCKPHKHASASQNEFGRALGHAGFGSKKSHGVRVYLDVVLSAPETPGGGQLGTIGDHFPVEQIGAPHEGVNGEIVPNHPQSSPDPLTSARPCVVTPPPRVPCYACKTERYWHARDGTMWLCGVCEPPSADVADPVWSGVSSSGGVAEHSVEPSGNGQDGVGDGGQFAAPRIAVPSPWIIGGFGAMQNPEAH